MRQALTRYGHCQPTLFYTDNMADKQFLESCFPSLQEDIVPVEKYAHLDPLVLPDDVTVFVHGDTQTIDQAILAIVDDAEDPDSEIVVGLDTEWNVDLLAATQSRSGRSRTAILQIAYKKRVYILQVSADATVMRRIPHTNFVRAGFIDWETSRLGSIPGAVARIPAES